MTYECGFRDLDESNDGARRGSVCHYVLECLIKPRHHHYIEKILKSGCYKVPAIARLIRIYAKNEGLEGKENFELVDKFIKTGLKADFFCAGWKLEKAEEEFNIEKDGYKIRGFIDKHATKLDENKARIDDYKSSKNKFSGKDAEFNIQAYMYALALYEKYGVDELDVNFVFLKFPRQPFQSFKITSKMLKGFEHYLTRMYSYLEDFNTKKAYSNFARDNDCWRLCGKKKNSTKKDGSPAWVCPWKYPMIYYEAKLPDKDKIQKSRTKEKLVEMGCEESSIQERYYSGCPRWNVAKAN